MTKAERKCIEWIGAHLPLLVFLAAGALGALIRFSLRAEGGNGDLTAFLLPWYDTIKARGGLSALSEQVGDYNVLYQFLIALMTYLPIKPLYAYKLLSIGFDYLLAGTGAYLAYLQAGKSAWKAALVWSILLLLPSVWLNSACWAQCDSIYAFFCILSLVFLAKDRFLLCFLSYGLAFAFKLQAIFLLPFFLYAWLRQKRFSCLHFLILPAVLLLSGLPAALFGRSPLDVFRVYAAQTGTWEYLLLGYPNIWAFVSPNGVLNSQYYVLKTPAVLLTFGVLMLLAAAMLRRQSLSKGPDLLRAAFLLCWTCVMLLPGMHERYDHLHLILCGILAMLDLRFLPILTGVSLISLCGYGDFLFDTAPNWQALAAVNAVLYTGSALSVLRGARFPAKGEPHYE